jgi:hypothetical protein
MEYTMTSEHKNEKIIKYLYDTFEGSKRCFYAN